MTTDNKALADVQPGGRVRLGDGDEKPPQELPKLIVTRGDGIPLPDQAAAIEEFKRQCLRRVESEYPHLSAQPSPGGQGDALLESLVARWRNHAEEIGVSDNMLCQKIANCTMRHAAELQAVLAARQPVGVPAMYQVRPRSFPAGEGWREVSKRQFDDRGEFPGYPEAEWERRTLYAAAPAQVVDLSMLIAKIDQALGYLSTALDDLDSSPDRRPSVMVDEAMGCLRQALTGVPNG